MRKALRIGIAVLVVVVVAFVVMVVCGVGTALNAAPGYTLSTSKQATDTATGLGSEGSSKTADTAACLPDSAPVVSETSSNQQEALHKTNASTSSSKDTGKTGATAAKPSAPAPAPSGSTDSPKTPGASGGSAPAKVWVAEVTKIIPHDAEYRYDPVYSDVAYEVCNNCGYKTVSDDEMTAHLKSTRHAGWHEEWAAVQTGTKKVLVSPAYNEVVIITPGHWE